jgi:hypothetical protein
VVEIVSGFKYLGILIDRKMNFANHVDHIIMKLRQALAAMYKLAHLQNSEILKSFYHSCFQSHINYCVSVWGNLTINRTESILRMQKKALRLIYNVSYDYHTAELFKRSEILPFQANFIYRLSLYTYKQIHLDNIITHDNSIRFKITGKLLLPSQHCRMFTRSFMVLAIRIFNWCGDGLFRQAINGFKKDIKTKILSLDSTRNGMQLLINGCWNV